MPDESAFSHFIRSSRAFGLESVDMAAWCLFRLRSSRFAHGDLIPLGQKCFSASMSNPFNAQYLYRSTDLPFLGSLGDSRPPGAVHAPGRQESLWTVRKAQAVAVKTVGMCIACCQHQRSHYGFSWWLRHHALPSVCICSLHNVVLQRAPFAAVVKGTGLLPHELDATPVVSADAMPYARRLNDAIAFVLKDSLQLPVESMFSCVAELAAAQFRGDEGGRSISELVNELLSASEAAILLAATPASVRDCRMSPRLRQCPWVALLHFILLGSLNLRELAKAHRSATDA